MNEKVKMRPLIVALDLGHDINDAAQKYVESFNEVGGFVILSYKVRHPEDKEVAGGKIYNPVDFVKRDGKWFTQAKDDTGKIVTKQIFVIEILDAERLPKNIEEMKVRKAQEKFTSVPGVKKG